jgi:hypothetical protein
MADVSTNMAQNRFIKLGVTLKALNMRLLWGLALHLLTLSYVSAQYPTSKLAPIILGSSGGFVIAGKTISNPRNPNQTLSCDHAYVEYFMPWTPRRTSIVMWHSSTTQTWQNRWDGGEGFKDMWLRRDYPVYLWESPRQGRANWACVPWQYTPSYRDQGNFGAWNFGPRYPNWWSDVQFPTEDPEAWYQATSSRYVEFDGREDVHLHSRAAAIAADSGKMGDHVVFLTNSAAGLRAQLAAVKANSTNIKAIVMYESVGYVFPDDAGIREGGGFGPFLVPVEDFKRMAQRTAIQFIFGDHREESYQYVRQAREMAKWLNYYGGKAEVLMLGRDAGLWGSTHVAFADMHNEKVAALLDNFLEEHSLDGYNFDGLEGQETVENEVEEAEEEEEAYEEYEYEVEDDEYAEDEYAQELEGTEDESKLG